MKQELAPNRRRKSSILAVVVPPIAPNFSDGDVRLVRKGGKEAVACRGHREDQGRGVWRCLSRGGRSRPRHMSMRRMSLQLQRRSVAELEAGAGVQAMGSSVHLSSLALTMIITIEPSPPLAARAMTAAMGKAPPLRPPKLMGRYELGKLLYKGSFAKVMREINIMRRVRHPNIVHIHEVMATKRSIFLIMEFGGGSSLDSYLAGGNGGLHEAPTRRMFQQLSGESEIGDLDSVAGGVVEGVVRLDVAVVDHKRVDVVNRRDLLLEHASRRGLKEAAIAAGEVGVKGSTDDKLHDDEHGALGGHDLMDVDDVGVADAVHDVNLTHDLFLQRAGLGEVMLIHDLDGDLVSVSR
ncbi:hypothetical protein HU200_065256 [Digitaria exilis]|uniref:Protein kinase domain-containing protein n=1 Tax=Digitaria exilis TaxID=1010633 RepID=A0A835DXK9_9POAL|nr:hypothetical protein HU200_065256 [Digitaria exilis]